MTENLDDASRSDAGERFINTRGRYQSNFHDVYLPHGKHGCEVVGIGTGMGIRVAVRAAKWWHFIVRAYHDDLMYLAMNVLSLLLYVSA
jgi:hypothetical protein